MPGIFFHAKSALSYYIRQNFNPEVVENKIIYSILPDCIIALVDGMNEKLTHDRKNYSESSDPWIYSMINHHLDIDNITDNKKNGILNGELKELRKNLSRFPHPKKLDEILMDMALDFAQVEEAKQYDKDLPELLNRSKENIDPEALGNYLAYGFDDSPREYIALAEEMKNFDFNDLTSYDGVLNAISKYYLERETKKRRPFGKRIVKRLIKNKKDKVRSIIDETKHRFLYDTPSVSDIHNRIDILMD